MRKTIFFFLLILIITPQSLVFASYGFTDQEIDPEAGLYYFDSREYDPNIGKFLQQDPLLKDGSLDIHFLNSASQAELNDFLSNPQNLNPYSYTRNNPVNYVDPTGNSPDPFASYKAATDELSKRLAIGIDNFVSYFQSQGRARTSQYAEQFGSLTDDQKSFFGSAESYGNAMVMMEDTTSLMMGVKGGIKGFTGEVNANIDTKFIQKAFDLLGAQGQKVANNLFSQFQKIITGTGKLIHEVGNTRAIKDGGKVLFYELKHNSGVRVYINKIGEVIGFSNKNNQSGIINKLINIFK